jgi:ribosomal protein S13
MKSGSKEIAHELKEATITALENAGINTTKIAGAGAKDSVGVKMRSDPTKKLTEENIERAYKTACYKKLRH